jgi:hypothetical protein
VIFSGVSAGCFPATILALGIDVKEFFFKENVPLIEEAAQTSYAGLGKCVHAIHSPTESLREPILTLVFRWIPMVKQNTLNMLPTDAYKKVNQKLCFSITEVRLHCVGSRSFSSDQLSLCLIIPVSEPPQPPRHHV